jgi:hypothetical protein
MSLSNIQLEEMCREHSIPLIGVFMKDELPKYRQEGAYIINLEDSMDSNGNDNSGTHWTGLWIKKRKAVYFDPFGFIYPLEVRELCKDILPILYSTKEIQNITSTICGYYVFYFLFYMNRHVHKPVKQVFSNFLTEFMDNPRENKAILVKKIRPL